MVGRGSSRGTGGIGGSRGASGVGGSRGSASGGSRASGGSGGRAGRSGGWVGTGRESGAGGRGESNRAGSRSGGPGKSDGRRGADASSGVGRSGSGRSGANQGRTNSGRGAFADVGSAGSGRSNSRSNAQRPGPPGPRAGSSFGGPPPRGRRSTGPHAPTPSGSSNRGLGGDLVEGRQAVRELLLAGRRRTRDVWMADGTDDSPILGEIEQLASEARVTIHRVSREQLLREARTETPQGVLAHAEELREVEFDDLMARRNGKNPFLLAVDSVTDPQNLGALLRSADGAGVTGVILPKHRTVHVTPTVTKAAAGAIERIPMALVGGLPSALLRAKEKYEAWVLGLDADGPRSLYELSALGDAPLIVVIGAEGAGLSRLVRDRCDELVSIPLRGALASLNASVAGAVAMFELGRHR